VLCDVISAAVGPHDVAAYVRVVLKKYLSIACLLECPPPYRVLALCVVQRRNTEGQLLALRASNHSGGGSGAVGGNGRSAVGGDGVGGDDGRGGDGGGKGGAATTSFSPFTSPPCIGETCPGSSSFLVNARNDYCSEPGCPGGTEPYRAVAYTDDAGVSWSPRTAEKGLPEPHNGNAGLVRHGNHILFTNPTGAGDAGAGWPGNLTLHVSEDEAVSWTARTILWPGSVVGVC